jgi:hypothetical protein
MYLARLVFSPCLLAAALVACGTLHAAPPKLRNISKEIGVAGAHVVSAEVWLVPPGRESRFEITESDLPDNACSYRAAEPFDLYALLRILEQGGLMESATPNESLPVGAAIYLLTNRGQRLTLLLTPEYTNAPSLGLYNGSVSVIAKNGLENSLWSWARARQSTRNVGLCRHQLGTKT